MNEERKLILEMLKEGTVSVDEAERLIAALGGECTAEDGAQAQSALVLAPQQSGGAMPIRPKRLVVCVTKGDKPMVNVRLPFSLVRVGLRMGKKFTAIGAKHDAQTAEAFEILQDIDIDELLDSISDGDITLPYTIVDVDDDEKGEHVRIVLE